MATREDTGSVRDGQLAGCGCLETEVRAGTHRAECVVRLRLAVAPSVRLAFDAGSGREPRALGAVRAGGADLEEPEVMPEGVIVRLHEYGLPGLWQRQGGLLVPVSEDAYVDGVRACQGYGCGICDACQSEEDYVEGRVRGAVSLRAVVGRAELAIEEALELLRWEREDATGGDFELATADAGDAEADLREAGRRVRAVLRIVEAHEDNVVGLAAER